MKRYNLTGTQNFYGQKDVKTYYNVPANKVWAGMLYMSENFNLPNIFVYEKIEGVSINHLPYVGSYSRKYKNFKDRSGNFFTTYNF